MELKNCKVSIGRNSNDAITIELTDRDSGTRFFRGEMTLEDFARAVTGQTELPLAKADVRGLDRLGLVQEVKELMVPIPDGYEPYRHDDFAKDHAAWVRPYEVDGWTADTDTRFNHHRGGRNGGQSYKTYFRRWVKKETP